MKSLELENLITNHTTDESGLDISALSESINTQFNALLDKKMPDLDKAKDKWELDYTETFYKDLGVENINNTSDLKTYIDTRKDYDPKQLEELTSTKTRLTQERDIYKSNFSGDVDDMDFIIHKANTMISAGTDLSFTDAVNQLREAKPNYFGTETKVTTNVKVTKPVLDTVDPIVAAFNKRRR